MEPVLAVLVGLFLAVAVYFLLSRALVRMLIGLVVLANGLNLLIFVAGRLTREGAPIIAEGRDAPSGPIANALPQALILTAIVIGFSMFVFMFVLGLRAYQAMDADDTNSMRLAEPEGEPNPPLSY